MSEETHVPRNSPHNARKNPKKSKAELAAQQGAILANRLKRFITYTGPHEIVDPETGLVTIPKQLMTPTQVMACLGLLKKYMPDLKSIELVGDDTRPVVQRIERVIVDSDPANRPSIPAAADPEPL